MPDNYIFKSPIGFLKISEENNKITSIYLLQKEYDIGAQNYERHSDLLYEAYRQLNEYFSGKRKSFDMPLEYKGTVFQQKVWRELQRIPYGETRSYEDIAVSIGKPKTARAIGYANSKNHIMIIIPCHRVICKSGNISGFIWGSDVKKYLLDLEKRYI